MLAPAGHRIQGGVIRPNDREAQDIVGWFRGPSAHNPFSRIGESLEQLFATAMSGLD
jgi:hypothetical protein